MDCTSPVFGFPCGKCLNCRARSRQEWVFRLRMELRDSDFGLFVTLTYDDDHLPLDGVCKRDVQLFLKRLRKLFDSRTLRYYLSSEYGDHGLRPHYHALLFFNGQQLSNDIYDKITNSWQNGFVQFGEVEEGSIVYCTKYILKGSEVPLGMNDNFRLLSKMNGGIGKEYLVEQADYHLSRLDKPTVAYFQSQSAPMPRYYRYKFYDMLPEDQVMITKLRYQEAVAKLRYKAYMKQKNEYFAKHRNLDPLFDESSFDHYLEMRRQRKLELFDKHTKKQTVL